MIDQPGIYDLPEHVYHSDPCPEPSLSGSIAIPLIHKSPLHAWHKHGRLNPQAVREDSKRLDLGSAVHKLVLGVGADISVLDFDNFQKKAAQEARDEAYEAGKIPLLAKDFETTQAMAKIAKPCLPSGTGKAEQTIIWQEGKAWCRGMVDWLGNDLRMVFDYKTIGTSADPQTVSRQLFDQSYHLKSAFYERGLNVIDPANIGRRKFLFLFQEITPPYAVSGHVLSEGAMTIGRKQATYAIRRWQECMATNTWPSYADLTNQSAPPWVEKSWLQREETDDFATGETSPDGSHVAFHTSASQPQSLTFGD